MFRKSSLFATGLLAIALSTSAMAGQPGAENSINPQPLPPRVLSGVLQQQAAIATAGIRQGSRVMINPQPLPPKQQYGSFGIR